jgi:pyrroline-5-carboxylate reductase
VSIKLAIVGGGVMAEAIISRLVQEKVFGADQILVSEPQLARRDYLHKTYAVQVTEHNREAFYNSDVLLLAIKPQVLGDVVKEIEPADHHESSPLLISILAGVTLAQLANAFPSQPIIRVMPNTPAIIGSGMSVLAPSEQVLPSHLSLAKSIFAAVGQVIQVEESLMDAVTALSGSGPAFVAMMVEALADGGVASGLPRAIANKLALETVLGTTELLKESKLHPGELKDRVTSPGGTTIAGVLQLEKRGFRAAVIEAVKAAYLRAQELGNLGD